MAVKLKKERGDRRGRYSGFELLNSGAYALSYAAESPGVGRVFFKQYKSPSVTVDWYPGFMAHQHEIKRRIEADPAVKGSCYQFIEFFEHRETKFGTELREFCQVFEFIDASKTLTQKLESRADVSWRDLTIFAKVLALGIHGLHNVGIVHTDLKPDNIILIPDSSIATGYRLRVIDLDWAIFSDRQAPWHGKQGYVGTPGYLSPEHVQGKIPAQASDVFTTGIMLSQVLAARHPFAHALGDDTRYALAVKRGEGNPIRIDQPLDGKCDMAFVHRILNATLNPDPKARPTLRQVVDAMIGKTFEWKADFELKKVGEHGRKPEPKRAESPEPAKPKPPKPAAGSKSIAVSLVFGGSVVATANVDAEFGKRSLAKVHADAQYLSNPQFRLVRDGSGWAIEHCPGATNDTLLDGKKLESRTPVSSGMTVCVGNAAKGVAKLPLVLQVAGT
jgi:serine/threonine protein kinase